MNSNSGNYICLQNNRLKVELSKPNSVYNGARFDQTGLINQVTLDGKHMFCTSEAYENGPSSGGRGLYNEFGIDTPVGYDEVLPGNQFTKIGVGLLTRDDKNYDFMETYEKIPYLIVNNTGNEKVEFLVEPMDCNGYSVRLKKTISINDNRLKISYELQNTGEKRIRTQEYCHNFISINHEILGSEYLLRTSFEKEILEKHDKENYLTLCDDVIKWCCKPYKFHFYSFDVVNEPNEFFWEIYNKTEKTGVRETCNFRPYKFNIWGVPHVISPEMFYMIDIMPQETKTWERNYDFFID